MKIMPEYCEKCGKHRTAANHLFKFPKNPIVKQLWIEFIDREENPYSVCRVGIRRICVAIHRIFVGYFSRMEKYIHLYTRNNVTEYGFNVSRSDYRPHSGSVICSDHFDEIDIKRHEQRTRLASNAIPRGN